MDRNTFDMIRRIHQKETMEKDQIQKPIVLTKEEAEKLDNEMVDQLATAMKKKMAEKRAAGFSGWNELKNADGAYLTERLCSAMVGGDPLNVANLAGMLLWHKARVELTEQCMLVPPRRYWRVKVRQTPFKRDLFAQEQGMIADGKPITRYFIAAEPRLTGNAMDVIMDGGEKAAKAALDAANGNKPFGQHHICEIASFSDTKLPFEYLPLDPSRE